MENNSFKKENKMTKIILTIATTLLSITTFSQLAIGVSNVSNKSVSLQFGTENRGLLLPWVDNLSAVTNASNGTLIYDAADKKVKIKYAFGWKDLSVEPGSTIINGVDALNIQTPLMEEIEAKVSIGEASTPAQGILVLEDTTKAMVLPKVDSPHLNIINPSPGLMVYDESKELFAVFNGEVWTYWRASVL